MNPPRPASTARLEQFLAQQRWYATAGAPPSIATVERVALDDDAGVTIAIVELADGTRYQLVQSDSTPDRASQPEVAASIARFVAAGAATDGADGPRVTGHHLGRVQLGRSAARPLGAEQSNTSVTVGGTHVLKVLRRLHAGPHPEVEIGQHLATDPTAPAPRLDGWLELVEPDGTTMVLAVLHRLVSGALDGWSLVLSALAADPTELFALLHRLGATVAALHGSLARPAAGSSAGFGTEPLDPRELWAVGDEVLGDPDVPHEARHLVANAIEQVGADTGAAIRIHGDLHLGQTLVGPDGWVILDFEGEPARTVADRSLRSSPLRDVAGMARSLAYAAATHQRAGGRPLQAGWEAAARAALLDGYLATVDPDLVPRSAVATHHLLTLYELHKAAYEVRYERAHRPDWVDIPLAGLARLIQERP